MTIDKAVNKMKCLKYKALQGAIIVHDTYSDDYDLLDESALIALDMALISLETWEDIRQEIVKQISKVPTFQNEYLNGLKTAYAHTLAIIDEHLQEVTE